MLLSCGALFLLALASYWSARLAWADHLSTSTNLENRRRAVLLAPRDATLYIRLAEKLEETGGDPIPSLKAAAALDPDNPEWRMTLGQHAEFAGDLALAERNLAAAARLSSLYQPKYLLAGYYFRRENADLCIRWSRAALAIAPGDVTPVLKLLERLLDPQALAAEAIRQPRAVARQFLSFLAQRNQTAAAGTLARYLAGTATPEDLPALLGYANQLLGAGHGLDAEALWNTLCTRHLLPYELLGGGAGRALTNADFHRLPIESGFDWHIEVTPGVHVAGFDGSLRATFSGDQTDDSVLIWEYVPLETGTRYRLRQEVRADNLASAAGLQWRLFYPQAGPQWLAMEANLPEGFRAPAEVGRLVLLYRRAAGTTRLTGDVLVNGLRLDREP